MEESIFNRLFRYKATEKVSPEENYLTEMLCWLINNCPCFAQDYVKLLKQNDNDEAITDIHAETQIYVSKGIIDMVIYAGQNVVFICEHKVNSTLRDNQIQDYVNCQKELGDNYVFKTVLLTKSISQHTQYADIKIIWNDIYNHINANIDNYYENEKQIVEQFLLYLTEVGMGKKNALRVETANEYCMINDFEVSLKSIFNDINSEMANENELWEKECMGITAFVGGKQKLNVSVKKRWGRLGIDFTKEWEPNNIFAGVLLDNSDHKIKDWNDSPKLVIIVDCIPEEKYVEKQKKWYKLIEGKKEANGFNVETDPKNQWRMVILSKPLTDVIGYEKYEEQKENIKKEIIKGINIILGNT